jgi:circadian clock protein KaiC
MKKIEKAAVLEKCPTGVWGLDWICEGGLPRNRTTLVCGTSGSAKTMFAVQFLMHGILEHGEPGVFVTFEETPEDIRASMLCLGWDIARLEKKKLWTFIDATRRDLPFGSEVGDYDFGAFILRLETAVRSAGARRVSIDTLGAVFSMFEKPGIIRHELHRVSSSLKKGSITTVMTAERDVEYGEVSRYRMEEFVADNVIILRNVLEEERRRRTMEVLKLRGGRHQKGEYAFTILTDRGLEMLPISFVGLEQKSSTHRITSGNTRLDKMCGGGFFRDSIILISGPTGTGKTLLATEFIRGGANRGERSLIFAFEESHEQLCRNAIGWGVDFRELEKQGKLKIVCRYPEVANIEEHLIFMKEMVEEFRPKRVAVDSLSALERTSSRRGFREFVLCLTAFIKQQQIAGLFTSTTPVLLGATSITDAHISTITDSIILLRYMEIAGHMRRGMTVLKMRGSKHEKNIREFSIADDGLEVGETTHNVMGILSGDLRYLPAPGSVELASPEE